MRNTLWIVCICICIYIEREKSGYGDNDFDNSISEEKKGKLERVECAMSFGEREREGKFILPVAASLLSTATFIVIYS